MEFTGRIRSFYDGENTEGEGVLHWDGRDRTVSFSGSASARGAEFVLDGRPVDPESGPHGELTAFFEDLWPYVEEAHWEAEVVRNGIASTQALPEPD